MLRILEFIFQDFDHWLGTVILIAVIFGSISEIFNINIGTKNNDEDEI